MKLRFWVAPIWSARRSILHAVCHRVGIKHRWWWTNTRIAAEIRERVGGDWLERACRGEL